MMYNGRYEATITWTAPWQQSELSVQLQRQPNALDAQTQIITMK